MRNSLPGAKYYCYLAQSNKAQPINHARQQQDEKELLIQSIQSAFTALEYKSDAVSLPVGSADIIAWTGISLGADPADIYVEVELEGRVVQRTRGVKRNGTPSWNEELSLYVR